MFQFQPIHRLKSSYIFPGFEIRLSSSYRKVQLHDVVCSVGGYYHLKVTLLGGSIASPSKSRGKFMSNIVMVGYNMQSWAHV